MKAESDSQLVTHDRLLGGRVLLDQPATGYRAAVDPVLLAAAVPARAGDTVLELGSGAGAASLCLAARAPDCSITGIERDSELVSMANVNAAANGVDGRVTFRPGDVSELPPDIPGAPFDHAMANPPFLEPGRADLRAVSPQKRDAMVEGVATLDVWLAAMCRAVKPKGHIVLIHRADRLADVLALLRTLAGDIAILPLWPKAGRPARRVIVTARPATSAPTRLLHGLVLHGDDGRYTPAVAAVLQDGAPLDL